MNSDRITIKWASPKEERPRVSDVVLDWVGNIHMDSCLAKCRYRKKATFIKWVHVPGYIFQFCLLRGPSAINTLIATRTPSTETLISHTTLQSNKPGLIGEMTDSRTQQGTCKINLEHSVVSQMDTHKRQWKSWHWVKAGTIRATECYFM